jgi:hypothetical protein
MKRVLGAAAAIGLIVVGAALYAPGGALGLAEGPSKPEVPLPSQSQVVAEPRAGSEARADEVFGGEEGRATVRTDSLARADEPNDGTRPAPPRAADGTLLVDAVPWGEVYVDDHPVGMTPRAVPLRPGRYTVRVVREGYEPLVRAVEIAPGARLGLTDLVLTASRR